ncbi:similar to Saccharomyces cerevisiae YLR073C RFU1 Protein that inhibits Doa4p deubiquitinating activity [Maudiozyma saulgeensis]|uniref:Regulator of free ubiquitin chains 1 n=1 Tax=Maudiozyma saulgeensis TaxID=1789683 RepID=A0A1X7QYR1_9SACH|nr:similar to Saccharomyces cerevisiae YLR073C RFU1 Protein that inhibits Doa4p deubiquitinating activity [Kazachstania saulgeensis]
MLSSVQLAQEAKDYKFNPAIPLRIYLKTCIGILDKAQLSFQTGDNARAFMYYYRYVDLCTNKLSRHPEFLISEKPQSDPDLKLYRQEYLQLIKLEVPAVLRIIEDLKNRIDAEWERHQVSLAKNIARNRVTQVHGSESKREMVALPPSFNEQNFQQSLNFLQNSSMNVSSRVRLSHTTTFSTLESSTDNTQRNNVTERATEETITNSTTLLHYPELPQLSFPTF